MIYCDVESHLLMCFAELSLVPWWEKLESIWLWVQRGKQIGRFHVFNHKFSKDHVGCDWMSTEDLLPSPVLCSLIGQWMKMRKIRASAKWITAITKSTRRMVSDAGEMWYVKCQSAKLLKHSQNACAQTHDKCATPVCRTVLNTDKCTYAETEQCGYGFKSSSGYNP